MSFAPLYIHRLAVRSAIGNDLDRLLERLTDPTPFDDAPTSDAPGSLGASGVDFAALRERFAREHPDFPKARTTRGFLLLWDAAEELLAGLSPALRERVLSSLLIVVGNATSGLNEAVAHARAGDADDLLRTPLELGLPSADLARVLGSAGSDVTLSTACTASGKALCEAARRLLAGEADFALAGGFDVLNPFTDAGFAALGALSERRCAPWTAERSGLHLGEGGALFLLSAEPYLAEEPALAALAGWGETSDAHHISAPHPEGAGALSAMQKALEKAGRNPTAVDTADSIDFVLLHGTATAQNDAAEAKTLDTLFAGRPAPVPCASLKRATGHTLAGAAALNAAVAVGLLSDRALEALEDGSEMAASVSGEAPSRATSSPLPLAFRAGEGRTLDPALASKFFRPTGNADADADRPAFLGAVLANAFAFGGNNVSLVFTRTRPPRPGWTTDDLLPQQPPMRFLTAVHAIESRPDRTPGARGGFTVPPDHIMVTPKGFPATGLLEVMAQTIGLYAGAAHRAAGESPRIGLLLGCRKLTFGQPFYPVGARFETSVEEVFRSDDGLRQFAARVEWMTDDGPVPAADALLTVYQPSERMPFSERIE